MNIYVVQEQYTALHLAVEHGRHQAVQTLLGYGAQVQLKGGKVNDKYLFCFSHCQVLSPPHSPFIFCLKCDATAQLSVENRSCTWSLNIDDNRLNEVKLNKWLTNASQMLLVVGRKN